MNKIINLLLITIFLSGCSFNKNSKFWTSDTIEELEEKKFEQIFTDEKALGQEFNINVNLNLGSNFTKSGEKFNLGLPSIQNPVAISQVAGSPIPSTITVTNTTYFPSSGYIYHTNGGVFGIIEYTGKTANQFTGCTLYSGSNQITSGSEIVPISPV